jgi:hypothetical protein
MTIENNVAQHESERELIAFKKDFQQTPHRAMSAVASDDVSKSGGFRRVIGVEQLHLSAVTVLLKRCQRNGPLYGDPERGKMLG